MINITQVKMTLMDDHEKYVRNVRGSLKPSQNLGEVEAGILS